MNHSIDKMKFYRVGGLIKVINVLTDDDLYDLHVPECKSFEYKQLEIISIEINWIDLILNLNDNCHQCNGSRKCLNVAIKSLSRHTCQVATT